MSFNCQAINEKYTVSAFFLFVCCCCCVWVCVVVVVVGLFFWGGGVTANMYYHSKTGVVHGLFVSVLLLLLFALLPSPKFISCTHLKSS